MSLSRPFASLTRKNVGVIQKTSLIMTLMKYPRSRTNTVTVDTRKLHPRQNTNISASSTGIIAAPHQLTYCPDRRMTMMMNT